MCGSNHETEEHQTGEGPTVRPLPVSYRVAAYRQQSLYSQAVFEIRSSIICLLSVHV